MSLQIRRGTNADRISITPEVGELLYTTDTNALYVGNGVVPGGILVSAGNTIYGNAQVLGLLASGNVNTINANTIGALTISVVGVSSAGYLRTDNYQWANGQAVSFSGTYTNANVAAYLPTYTGNLVSLTGNVTTTANISGAYILGNGSQLTGLPAAYSNANVFAYMGSNSNVVIRTSGNITGGNVTALGNIQGAYVLGNGSQLTGLPAQYSNSNVSSYLQGHFSSNIIPLGNGTQSLGNATNQFKDLWVSNSTIYIDTIPLTSVANTLTWKSNAIPTLWGNRGNLNLGNGDIFANTMILTGPFNAQGNCFIAGNLTVLGNIDYTFVNDLAVANSIIFTGSNNTTNILDLGLVSQYGLGNGNIFTGLVRNHSTGVWTLFDNLANQPVQTVDWANTVAGNLTLGTLNATQILGNIANTTGLSTLAYTGNWFDIDGYPTNISYFNNDVGYITVSGAPVQSVNGQTGNVVITIPTLTSNLTNDSGFITTANANVISVNGQSGNVTLSIPTATSNLTNDSGFITTANANVISVNGQTGVVVLPANDYGNANVAAYLPTYTGNLNGGNLFISGTSNIGEQYVGNLFITGNADLAGQMSANLIYANVFLGDGGQLSNIQGGNISGNISVANITASGTANITGNIETAGYFLGNGALLTGIASPYGNANVFNYLGSNSNVVITTTGNVTANVISTTGNSGNIQGVDYYVGNNIILAGNVRANGNIQGNYILGNGAFLTGITTTSYGNSNVANYLASGNVSTNIITTANVNSANLNISRDAFIAGNLTIGANLNVVNVNEYVGATGNVSFVGNLIPATNGNVYSLGLPGIRWANIYSTYLHGDGSNLTGISGGGNSTIIQNGTSNVTIPVANNTVTINASNTQSWQFNTNGELLLPAQNVSGSAGESQILRGTRKIINGALTGATTAYAVQLNAGPTPTVAYTSSPSVLSCRVTFAIQSSGAGFNWEQFDVTATASQDIAGDVNFVVSNRVKSTAAIADTVVTAIVNVSGQIEISLALAAGQQGWTSFDATEFGLMID
jgi:hypothetical protein